MAIPKIVLFYAFRLVEQAEAETDSLLHNILPGTIVNQLKEHPHATIGLGDLDTIDGGHGLHAWLTSRSRKRSQAWSWSSAFGRDWAET